VTDQSPDIFLHLQFCGVEMIRCDS